MYQGGSHQPKKSYSWAGHCRFKVIDDYTDDEEYYNVSDFQSQNERFIQTTQKNDFQYSPSDFKCKKPVENLTNQLSKPKIHHLEPIKETYVYLRNDRILQNLKLRRPKYVHLDSHPLRKVSSSSARKLKSVKNVKLLSFRDYGYKICGPIEYSKKYADPEEAQNGFLSCEDIITEKELSYLLSNTASLRKLYVMLLCNKWKTFKRLQTYARRQKNLQEFGFISDYGEKGISNFDGFPHYGWNVRVISTCLRKLEIRCDNESKVKIRGLNKLQKLRSFNCGGMCGGFPSAGSLISSDEDEFDESSEDSGSEKPVEFYQLDLISQVIRNPKIRNIRIKSFEILKFDRDFWNRFFAILEVKPHIKVTYEVLFIDSWSVDKDVFHGISEEIQNQDYEGAVQILVLEDLNIGESAFNGGGLKTQYFNFDKQYLFEIREYSKEKILSLSREASPSVSDLDIYNDIAFVGYIPGLH